MALALLWFGFACSRDPEGPPNVLLVTLDTLRADRLGAYGYAEAETPQLDRLADEGIRFDTALAQVPLTLPSHTTLLTGVYPMYHGVRDNGGVFGKDLVTLAEVARDAGYETAAFVSAFVLDSKWGLARGFDLYADEFELSRHQRISLASVERPAGETVDRFLDWLERPREKRFFVWLHLFDPHAPYQPPEPYRSRFRERPYDGEIAYVDTTLGKVFTALRNADGLEETLVVVAGDHGEGLGDHGELTHGNFVYESTLRVPLMVRLPGGRRAGAVVEEPVALIDLFPTLVRAFGERVPSQSEGEDLWPLLEGEKIPSSFARRRLLAETLYPRLHYGWSELIALRSSGMKLIDAPRPELYDLEADPGETRNLFREREELARSMRAELLERYRTAPSPGEARASLDSETEKRLRALGYIGGRAAPVEADRSELSDPKDKIELVHAISRADALGAAGELEEAVAILEDVLGRDPQIVDAYVSLGNKLSSARRYDEAIRTFQKALELQPDYDLALVNLALAYKMAGRLDEARPGFELILERDPANRQALYNLGEIAMAEKDYETALAYYREGLELESGSPVFLRQAGMAYYYQGDLARSIARLEEAIASKADLEMAHYMLALAYEKKGDLAAAEAAYLAEHERHPENYRASFNLAQLYGRDGRTMEQIGVLEELTERRPDFALGFIQLAKAYRDAGLEELYPKVLEACDRGLELDPDSELAPLAYYLRAEILDEMGREEDARRAFEKGRAVEERRRSRKR